MEEASSLPVEVDSEPSSDTNEKMEEEQALNTEHDLAKSGRRSSLGDRPDLTAYGPEQELNAILVGAHGCWKHLVGNIILGTDTFTSDMNPESEERQGTTCGRKVTLVKAPSWYRGYQPCDTPALFKTEMTLCSDLCPAGPHAFLLVVNTNLVFKESYRTATVEHLQTLYGQNVWDHTIIVFCSGLAQPAVDDYIQSEGAPLQMLMQQCGNRYHVLCNEDMNSKAKVKELFDKIDAMVSHNGGRRYECGEELMQRTQDKRREVEQKAAAMQLNSQTQRQNLQGLITGGWRPELRILMLGWVFAGKSKTANTILNAEEFPSSYRTLKSTVRCSVVDGRKVTIVDTPGWWKFFPAMFTPPDVRSEVMRAVSLCAPSPNVILLMVPQDTSFTEEQLKITLDNMEMLGERVWRHVIVVFPWGDSLGNTATIEHHIASEGKPLCTLIKLCGNRYHCLRDRTRSVTELLEKMEEMVAGNHFFYQSADTERDERQFISLGKGVREEGRGDETAKEVVHELHIRWDRQNWEMRYIKGNGSLDDPALMEPRRRSSLGLRPDLTAYAMLLEREWNRREICMEQNLGTNIWTIDVLSEPDATEKLRSYERIKRWLQKWLLQRGSKAGSGCGSSLHIESQLSS